MYIKRYNFTKYVVVTKSVRLRLRRTLPQKRKTFLFRKDVVSMILFNRKSAAAMQGTVLCDKQCLGILQRLDQFQTLLQTKQEAGGA